MLFLKFPPTGLRVRASKWIRNNFICITTALQNDLLLVTLQRKQKETVVQLTRVGLNCHLLQRPRTVTGVSWSLL